MSRKALLVPLLLASGVVGAEEAKAPGPERAPEAAGTQAPKDEAKSAEETKTLSGISILGNQEAPKSLVIVPWKTSEVGRSLGIEPTLDDSRQPVDREVFLRALSYYGIRSEKKP
jgi:hypothetical protein